MRMCIDTAWRTLEMLNEVYGLVLVCGYPYEAGRLLKEVDPIAFWEAEREYTDAQLRDGIWYEDENGDIYDGPPEESEEEGD